MPSQGRRTRLPAIAPLLESRAVLKARLRGPHAARSLAFPGLALATVLALAAAPGCQAPARPIFPTIRPPIVWPLPPDHPRIRYLGELTGQASLGAQPSGWDAVRAVLTGPAPTVAFSTPTAVAVAGERVYVADGQLGAVHILDLASRSYGLINRAGEELLQWPIDVAVLGPSTIAVADSRRAAVFLLDASGETLMTLGRDVLKRPVNLGWNPSAGELWVLDAALHMCVVFDREGRLLRRVGGRGRDSPGLNYPAGLACRAPYGLVVADSMNFRVQVWDHHGSVLNVYGQKGDAAGDFALPRDAAFDSAGRVFVLDSQFENVQIFDRAGRLLMAFGQEGHGPGEFYLPSGVTIDERDRIWIADTYNRRVQVFQLLSEDAQ